MNANEPSGKEASGTVDEQRAEWEGVNYGMTVCANGVVNVENRNYGDDSGAHTYSVEVVDGAEHFAAVEGARPAPVQHGTLPGAASGDQRDAAGERGDQNNAGDTSGHLYWIAIRAITGR